MRILGIETSSPLFSLAVNDDERIIYEIRKNRTMYAGSRDAQFFIEAKRLMESSKHHKIEAIAISIGPGMFTSLRVGLSLAKGISYAQNIPVVAVNTLDIIGISAAFFEYPVMAVIDAYHQEVYVALYKKDARVTDYLLKSPEEIEKIVAERTVVVGSGVDVLKKCATLSNSKDLIYVDDDSFLPTATKVIKIALPYIKSNKFDDIETLEPFYIKKTDAERNYDKANAV